MEAPPPYIEVIEGGPLPQAKIHKSFCAVFFIAGVVDVILAILMTNNITPEVINNSTNYALIIGYIIGGLSIFNTTICIMAVVRHSRKFLLTLLVFMSVTVILIASVLITLYNAYDVKSTNKIYNISMNVFFFFYILQFLIFLLNAFFVGREVWNSRGQLFRRYQQFNNEDNNENIPNTHINNPTPTSRVAVNQFNSRSSISSTQSEASNFVPPGLPTSSANPNQPVENIIAPTTVHATAHEPPQYGDFAGSVPLPSLAGENSGAGMNVIRINPIVALPTYDDVAGPSGVETRRDNVDELSLDSREMTRDRPRNSLDSQSIDSASSISSDDSDCCKKKKAPSSGSSLSSNAAAQFNPRFNNEKEREVYENEMNSQLRGAAADVDPDLNENMRMAHELYRNAMNRNNRSKPPE